MPAIAELTELEFRLEWELSPEEGRVATAALDELSEWARYHGRPTWESGNSPAMVKSLVLSAAARYMRNPDGYDTSRAGDETVVFQKGDGTPGSASFSKGEIDALRRIARPGLGTGLHSLQITAHGTKLKQDNRAGLVPAGEGFLFPLYSGEGPW